MNDLYQAVILEEAKNPQNFGEISNADLVHTETNASCGDTVTIFIELRKDKKVLQRLVWQGAGCVISQAAMSVFSTFVQGKKLTAIAKITKEDLLRELGLEEISAGRLKCLMLGLKAVQKIITSEYPENV